MIETRIPCPVCLGVKMVKQSPPQRRKLTLDLCPRCGGIWFDGGEINQLRAGSKFSLSEASFARPHTGRCHECHASVDRDAPQCSSCNAPNVIDCPQCARPMKCAMHGETMLDACDKCHGVWFDRHEIAAAWTIAIRAVRRSHPASRHRSNFADGDVLFPFEVIAYGPDVGAAIVDGSAHAAGAVVEGVAAAPEAVVEAAGSVFESLLEIIAGLFDGI